MCDGRAAPRKSGHRRYLRSCLHNKTCETKFSSSVDSAAKQGLWCASWIRRTFPGIGRRPRDRLSRVACEPLCLDVCRLCSSSAETDRRTRHAMKLGRGSDLIIAKMWRPFLSEWVACPRVVMMREGRDAGLSGPVWTSWAKMNIRHSI